MKLGELDILHHNACVMQEQSKQASEKILTEIARIERDHARIERTLQVITIGAIVVFMVVVDKLCNS